MTTNSNSNATERYFNLPTFLRYLHSSYSTFLHFHLHSHFTNIFWPLASHHDSHTSRRFIRAFGSAYTLCVHPFIYNIITLSYNPHVLFSTCSRRHLAFPAFLPRFDLSHCFPALIPYCIPALTLSLSCFRSALQDSHRP